MDELQKGYKIGVKNKKESEEVQKILFGLGFNWASLQNRKDTKFNFIHLTQPFLFFSYENRKFDITYMEDKEEQDFKMSKNKEITLEKLKSKKFQSRIKKLMILKMLDGENNNDK